MARKEGVCSLLCVPMMVRDKAVGVINSYTSVPHAFTSEEVKLLQAIANQAAIAIQHTTLLEKSFEMQEALAVRKLLERAKGYLMRSKKLTEEEAFRLIQRQSMDLRKSMREMPKPSWLRENLKNGREKQRDDPPIDEAMHAFPVICPYHGDFGLAAFSVGRSVVSILLG